MNKPIEEVKTKEIVEDNFKDGLELDTPSENKILQKIRFDKKGKKEFTTKEFKEGFIKNFVDRNHPILRLIRKVQNTNNTQKTIKYL